MTVSKNDPVTTKQLATHDIEAKTPDLDLEILESLQQTPYTCSFIQQLTDGFMNFTYRGDLLQPLEDGTRTVIIKHSEAICARVRHHSFSINRCFTEQAVLQALENAGDKIILRDYKNISIQTPRLHHYFPQSNTQIVEDLGRRRVLIDLLKPSSKGDLPLSIAVALGEALGHWISNLHAWSRNNIDAKLMKVLRDNGATSVQDYKKAKMKIVERQCDDEKVRRYAEDILSTVRRPTDVIVHGDFHLKNILISNSSSLSEQSSISLAVIDWETCSLEDYTRDLAFMVADFYLNFYFHGSKSALPMMRGLISTYPPLDEDAVYRTVALVGESFFFWRFYATPAHTKEHTEGILKLGIDLLVRGMERDRDWIESTFLGCLFRSG